jgi:outer membrane assembly lipoprotein YfiO
MNVSRRVRHVVTVLFLEVVMSLRGHEAAAQQRFTLTDEDQWKQTQAVDPATPEGQLAAAKAALAARHYARATTLASNWIERNERHAMLAEAYLIRADATAAGGDEYEALFDYEFIARSFPGSETFVTALQRELVIAKDYAGGKLRKLFGMRIIPAEDEAEEIFMRVQERMPGSRLGEDASMQLADFYFERRKMTLAAEAYSLFIENYPRSDQIDKARRRLIYSYLAQFKGPRFDARGLYEARARLNELKRLKPVEAERAGADALLIRIDESDAAKMLQTAQWYMRVGNPIAAEFTIRRLVKKYQRSVATTDALRLIPEIWSKLPESVRRQAPDYDALRAGILGVQKPEADK